MLNIPIRQVLPLDDSNERMTIRVKKRKTLDESGLDMKIKSELIKEI